MYIWETFSAEYIIRELKTECYTQQIRTLMHLLHHLINNRTIVSVKLCRCSQESAIWTVKHRALSVQVVAWLPVKRVVFGSNPDAAGVQRRTLTLWTKVRTPLLDVYVLSFNQYSTYPMQCILPSECAVHKCWKSDFL